MNFNTEKIIQHFQKLILKNKEAYKSHFTQIQDHFLSTFIEIIIFWALLPFLIFSKQSNYFLKMK